MDFWASHSIELKLNDFVLIDGNFECKHIVIPKPGAATKNATIGPLAWQQSQRPEVVISLSLGFY